ncbi:MAG: RdgB/HAM1 family non-canonical purine NTP pyrophosphatase [Anaerolineae bacterium]|nr:RdgB/HAM1 family non-canonical purine NTP pyrophosphatase [Anaerolineae bacterium]
MTPSLLIATNNPGKLLEMQALLTGLPVRLYIPRDLNIKLDVEENGSTYAENAALKAVAFGKASRMLTLADDSGLEVDALGGQPGLYSARYMGSHDDSDADRRAFLLKNLSGAARPWTAHFHCSVALWAPDESIQYAEGICPGEIIPQERGSNGFGYDPIFLLSELNKTMAELSMEEKNQLSHRARAIQAARPLITRTLALFE